VINANPVIRLTRRDRSIEIVERRAEDWTPHSHGDDVAACPLGIGRAKDYVFVEPYEMLIEGEVKGGEMSPVTVGDDCLMVGRYIDREHRQLDQPVLRFGNLAMLVEPVRQPKRAFEQESFLVEMRSLAGFSGSPVFVYYQGFGPRYVDMQEWERKAWLEERWLPGNRSPSGIVERHWLLGVDWGHIPVSADVIDAKGDAVGRMETNSGMAGVVPAWKLADLLQCQTFVEQRELAEAQLAREDGNAGVLEIAEPPEKAVPQPEIDERRGRR
jgi:hypothetical protein